MSKDLNMVKNIGMIGDSIAHGYYDEQNLGYFARLAQKILSYHKGEYVFNNMSQSGDNIADATHRALSEALSRHFDLILVNVGINDLRRRKDSDLQLDFSEGARKMYWNQLLDALALSKAKVVVLDLTPVIEEKYTAQASLVRYNSDVERYNEIIKEICKSRHISFFSRYDLWKNRNLNEFYKDATHPNALGHQIMADEIYDYLSSHNLI